MYKQKKLFLGIAAASLLMTSVASYAVDKKFPIEIDQMSADRSLMELAKSTGVQILLPSSESRNLILPPLSGSFTLKEALNKILDGTSLQYKFTSDTSIVISEKTDEGSTKEEDKNIEEVVVTGSRLVTDPGKMTRQVETFKREEIESSGATRLDEFLRQLPQNLNAPTNIGSGFPDADTVEDFGLGLNVFAGSSANLRGLGSQYTLILINGRRPPSGGQFGGITDISNIPIERVERIEILFDGAAAIYGADAVGGVINIITSREYQGTDLSVTYSETAAGGGQRLNFNLGHTFQWESGSMTANVGHQSQETITGDQRVIGFAEEEQLALPPATPGNVRASEGGPIMWVQDLNNDGDTLDPNERLSGGYPVLADVYSIYTRRWEEQTIYVDREDPLASFGPRVRQNANTVLPDPNDIVGYTPITEAQLPEYAGQAVSLYDIPEPGVIGNSEHIFFEGRSLSPEDKTYNVGFDLDQELGSDLKLSLSADYSKTNKTSLTSSPSTFGSIRADSESNPFNVDFRYGFRNNFPQEIQYVDQNAVSLSGQLDWSINDNWTAVLGFGVGEGKNTSTTLNRPRITPSAATYIPNLSDLFNGYADLISFDPETRTYIVERVDLDTDFNDPNLGYDNLDALLADITPAFTTTNDSRSRDIDLSLRGTLFSLPAGDVRSHFSIAHRMQENEITNNNIFFKTALLQGDAYSTMTETEYSEKYGSKANSVAGELSAPLVSEDMNVPFVKDLLFSASARYEEYGNVEDKGLNWASGLNWQINDWMTVRYNKTYSLKVPEAVRSAREQVIQRSPSYLVYNSIYDSRYDSVVRDQIWSIRGGSDHLESERNYGSVLGFIFRPTFVDGLNIQVNLTESATYDQIGSPNINRKLTYDALLPENVANNPLIRYADPENNPEDAFVFTAPGRDGVPVYYEAMPGDLIFDKRVFNIGNTFNRGADMRVNYNFTTDFGDWLITWRHQYLDTNEIVQSNICDKGAQCDYDSPFGQNFDENFNKPIDTVDTVSRLNFPNTVPLPRNSGSLRLNWDYKGLNVNLQGNYREETTIIQRPVPASGNLNNWDEGEPLNLYAETTKPAQSVNMRVSYDFANGSLFDSPSWLDSTQIAFTVDSIWKSDREVETYYIRTDYDQELRRQEINRYSFDVRGRAFSLKINTRF
ncbi:TonB-dependent receptor plug domain-containing protein [Porticoccaceae bacterium LTM1]|nr:TonB-dependent receptor plug domain-containing protein [Porticoccaceae bacterium LTM1]